MKTDSRSLQNRGSSRRVASRFIGRTAVLGVAALLGATGTRLEAGFVNATASSGINYTHAVESEVPVSADDEIPRPIKTLVSNYAGAAAVDVDGDGWTDLIAARYDLPPVLYINQGDGTFTEEATARGLQGAVNAGAFAAGDFDNDGDADLFVAPADANRFMLLVNDGTGHFAEEAVARGAAVTTTLRNHEAYSVGLVDYDRDGWLDVYVSEWGIPDSEENALHSVLLRNLGPSQPGHFENVTAASQLTQPAGAAVAQYGFSSGWADYDGDGWPDLALAADFHQSQLFWNNADGTFVEGSALAGANQTEFGMGIAVADYDGDGRLDFYVTSIYDSFFNSRVGTHSGNKLYRNLGDRRFAETSTATGVARAGWGWGAAFLDFDNDGDQDLVATNGMDAAELGATGPFYDALTDPTALFQNDGAGRFVDNASLLGIGDSGLGKAVVVWDYDNDGDEDLLITETYASPVLYRNDASANGRKWIRFAFRGNASNRDGIGAVVRVTEAGKVQTLLYNPSNSYIGQREPFLHCGLGASDGVVDAIDVVWPSGIEQQLTNVAANQLVSLVEPEAPLTPPAITTQPTAPEVVSLGSDLTLSAAATGKPAPVFLWTKDGETIVGANGPTLRLERIQPFDAGVYQARAINTEGEATSDAVGIAVTIDLSEHSIARWWDEFLLEAIRKDFPAPTIHGRNLYHTSAAMWDAFWAYEPNGWERASPVFHREDLTEADWGGDRVGSQREAISYAAYRILDTRYLHSVNRVRTLYNIRWLMEQLGYDPDDVSTSDNSPAGVGNRIGAAILAANLSDGANEANGYVDTSGYQAFNEPLVFKLPGSSPADPNRWQPLAFDYQVTQNGIPLADKIQSFVGVNWRAVDTFAIAKDSGITIAWDPGPPPFFGSESHAEFVDAAVQLIRYSSLLDPSRDVMIDISPGALLNNPLGTNDGTGHAVNPYTGKAYAPNVVNHADYGRILAEFWADGPASETPPGHWNSLFNDVTDKPLFQRRYLGRGPELSELEWDVQAYLALNGAMHDAAIAAWTLKRQYDYSRPITMIRYLAGLGQSTDPDALSYDPNGLPLIDGLIELVTPESSAAGQRHEALAASVGRVAILAWSGEPQGGPDEVGGVRWILAENWRPYQRSTFVTPAFPGYVSGHSTFSRAGAEVLTLLTGSPYFPGGIGTYHFTANEFLQFEKGPTTDVTLQWATYYDAADQAGLSRLYGGIHVPADDFVGRRLGARVGTEAFLKADGLRRANRNELFTNVAATAPRRSGDSPLLIRLDRSSAAAPRIRLTRTPGETGDPDEAATVVALDDQAGLAKVTTPGTNLRAVTMVGYIEDPGMGVDFRFGADGDAARLMSIRALAGDWLATPFDSCRIDARLELSLYQTDELGQEVLVATNNDARQGGQSSLLDVLALRQGWDESEASEIDAGLVIALESGHYRVNLKCPTLVGPVTLTVEEAVHTP